MLIDLDFLALIMMDLTLQLCLVCFLIVSDSLERGQFLIDLITLCGHLVITLCGIFKLPCHMIDMPLKSQDLLHIVLFFLLVLLDLERGTSDFFLDTLNLSEQVFVLSTDSLYGVLESFDLLARVTVVGKNVLLLDFKSS